LGYVNGNLNDEYIGTGWLISKDEIVTAGHCVYDHKGCSFLKYVKVYFGYDGPDSVHQDTCVYRRGVVVAAPAEYIKAVSPTHDVGFVSHNPLKFYILKLIGLVIIYRFSLMVPSRTLPQSNTLTLH
jgi:hypothetical protein